MHLKIERYSALPNCTLGRLYINGTQFCYTLEPKYRPLASSEDKVKGRTAIPPGTYNVRWSWSSKFRNYKARIMQVPWFDGILFHEGNTAKDTAGCVLLGQWVEGDTLLRSKYATRQFEIKVSSAIARGEKVEVEIWNCW